MNSVRNKLALAFFVIAAAAVAFVYLYVVPQLRSSLTAEKLGRLERVAIARSPRLEAAIGRGVSPSRLAGLLADVDRHSGARVTIVGVPDAGVDQAPARVIADSESERTAVGRSFPAAGIAALSGGVANAVEGSGASRMGETALVLGDAARERTIAVFSTGLADVDDNVALIRRQILIAGVIALVAALVAGWLVAGAHARRLRRLEAAAEKVADGDFSSPIEDDSGDEVGQLTASFNEMQKRLEVLDSARKEFIANASHELRTPIFSLSGFAELLDDDDPDPASRAEFVREIRGQVDRLAKLTVDLLDLSKLDADALEVRDEAVELAAVARRVAAEFARAADARGATIAVAPEAVAVARADADRVAQILRILIDNALKHTPEGTAIEVGTQTSVDGAASVLVSDDGPGIEPGARERVFDRFFTGDDVSGSGLGLAIARELAVRMGGSLRLRERSGRTEFELRLPCAEPVRA